MFCEKGGQLSERSEFLPARKTSAQRRETEGQGTGARFSAYSFVVLKKSKASRGSQSRSIQLPIQKVKGPPPQ